MKNINWKVWITAVLILTAAVGYSGYRIYLDEYEMEEDLAQTGDGVSEEFIMETFSDTFFDSDRSAGETANPEKDRIGNMLENSAESEAEEVQETSAVFYVYVCGAVTDPGVYRLEAGKRIVDAIEAAGGFAEDAAKEFWNLAGELADGMKIAVPTLSEAADDPYGWKQNSETVQKSVQSLAVGQNQDAVQNSGGYSSAKPLVNLNTADAALLQTLPGIGETRAEEIIAYREAHGGFSSIEDIMKIAGIKDTIFEKIRDKITV